MCIVLLSTEHPSYALIAIDNRDEYLLRPTDRLHWWSCTSDSGETHEVLSSRDLQKAERGTWMGVTRRGAFAVLTNFREPVQQQQQEHSGKSSITSRGGMVTAWLGGGIGDAEGVTLQDGIRTLVRDRGVSGVGGFSMACGRLRKDTEGIAIVSNRAGDVEDVPIVGREKGRTWGLSNARYNEEDAASEWPKVTLGKKLVSETVGRAAEEKHSEAQLVSALFDVLDTNTLPPKEQGMSFHEYLQFLRDTIYVPPLGDDDRRRTMEQAQSQQSAVTESELSSTKGGGGGGQAEGTSSSSMRRKGSMPASGSQEHAAMQRLLARPEPPDEMVSRMYEDGMYGTQRQTVMLVDWQGRVRYVERALWDERGRQVERGEGDVDVEFQIEGWES